MTPRQNTIDDIIKSESELVLKGAERYGDYFVNTSEFNDLLQNSIQSIDLTRFIFTAFLSQIKKHITLAWLSALRLHHIQAMMDLRQALEAGVCAAYAIANPDEKGFVNIDENGILDASQDLMVKRYKWLKKNFPDASKNIKIMKDIINKSSAHSNLIFSYNNFDFDIKKDANNFTTPFFDIEKEHLVKTDLWQIGNIAMGLMDLLYGVNKDIGAIKFIDDFIPRLKKLEVDNIKLKDEMKAILYERMKNRGFDIKIKN